MAFANT